MAHFCTPQHSKFYEGRVFAFLSHCYLYPQCLTWCLVVNMRLLNS